MIEPRNIIDLERESRARSELIDTRRFLAEARHELARAVSSMKFAYGYQMSTKNEAARELLAAIKRIDPDWEPPADTAASLREPWPTNGQLGIKKERKR